jgi:hypothetical protein
MEAHVVEAWVSAQLAGQKSSEAQRRDGGSVLDHRDYLELP